MISRTMPEPLNKTAPRKITLNDIALSLGVSKATVSLALNDDPRVAEKTKESVNQKAIELGYVYNRGAAGLSKGTSKTVGLVVHDFTNPYFTEVCATIEGVLRQNGRMPFLCNTHESFEYQNHFLKALIEHRVDGLILCPAAGTTVDSLQLLLNHRLPTVLITRYITGADFDFVFNDDHLSLKLTTEHLIKLGHQKIFMIGGGHQVTSGENRLNGYLEAMTINGLRCGPETIIDCELSSKDGEEAILRVMSRPDPPTGVVCLTDQIAMGVLSGLHKLRLKPGRDVAVTGCDDIEEAGRGYVQLTTARIQKTMIGQKATEMLLQRINNPEMPRQELVLDSELIIRKTCGSG